MSRGLLLLDSGNSSLKWQMLRVASRGESLSRDVIGQIVGRPVRAITNDRLSLQGLLKAWSDQAASAELSPCDDWQISWVSVGPSSARQLVSHAWLEWTGRRASRPWTPQRQLGVRTTGGLLRFVNEYRKPAQLGADRWLASLGLVAAGVPPGGRTQMVVSAGTATTVDLVRLTGGDFPQAAFLGGWIFPGFQLMSQSLRVSTRDLDRLMGSMNFSSGSPPVSDIPRDSASAIRQGILLAQAGCIHELARRHGVQTIWLHGGHADLWHEGLRLCRSRTDRMLNVNQQPMLVFAGLACRMLASQRF
jgi:pantothenate kinase type III